ncbi:MAG: hypothetical protein UY04_C0003G0006 [Parcubacteria group bacterium GW2011_GWA2_47_7]|nr:MAG: hypothetical protein UY04_C0003G0006 [Parcubacteria group bacterium GW2011_GWA2_47_7]
MRGREPSHEFTEVFVFLRIEYQVPVIWHEAVCQDAHIKQFVRLDEERFEMLIILLIGKDGATTVPTIEDVIDGVADGDAIHAGHEEYYDT